MKHTHFLTAFTLLYICLFAQLVFCMSKHQEDPISLDHENINIETFFDMLRNEDLVDVAAAALNQNTSLKLLQTPPPHYKMNHALYYEINKKYTNKFIANSSVCLLCTPHKEYTARQKTQEHILTVHFGMKVKCSECAKNLTAYSLAKHKLRCETTTTFTLLFICPHCRYNYYEQESAARMFSSFEDLLTHWKQDHLDHSEVLTIVSTIKTKKGSRCC